MTTMIRTSEPNLLASGPYPMPPQSVTAINQRPMALQATVVDPVSGTRGIVVVDSLVDGRAISGTRILSGLTFEGIAELAHLMSLKMALAEVAIGGAKVGVVLGPHVRTGAARQEALRAFGRQAGPLLRGGVYFGTDLGCSYEDRQLIFDSAGYRVRDQVPTLPCSWDDLWRQGRDVTGLGVAEACRVAADALNMPRGRRRMVIQGFGEVGQAAARAAEERGFTVVAVADKYVTVIDPDGLAVHALCDITDIHGTIDLHLLPPGVRHSAATDAWLDVASEVLVLAATGGVITESNHQRIKATLVVEGANQPTLPAAIEALHARDVLVVPDIVANAGGAVSSALVLTGEHPSALAPEQTVAWLFEQTVQRIGRSLRAVLDRSKRQEQPLHHIAHGLAAERLAQRESCSPA